MESTRPKESWTAATLGTYSSLTSPFVFCQDYLIELKTAYLSVKSKSNTIRKYLYTVCSATRLVIRKRRTRSVCRRRSRYDSRKPWLTFSRPRNDGNNYDGRCWAALS